MIRPPPQCLHKLLLVFGSGIQDSRPPAASDGEGQYHAYRSSDDGLQEVSPLFIVRARNPPAAYKLVADSGIPYAKRQYSNFPVYNWPSSRRDPLYYIELILGKIEFHPMFLPPTQQTRMKTDRASGL